MKLLRGLLVLLLSFTFTTFGSSAPNEEDAKLAEAYKKFLDEEFRFHPTTATALGNHDHDDRFDDLSAAARKADLERIKTELTRLEKAFDHDKLSRAGRIDLEIWRDALKLRIWQTEIFNDFENDPRLYVGMATGSVFSILTQSTLPRERNITNAARRIEFVPTIVKSAKESLKNPPKLFTEVAIKQNLGAIAFFEKEIFTLSGETPTGPLGEPCRKAVKSLKELQEFLEKELLPRSTGEWKLGKERFSQKLDMVLNAGISAEEVLKEAEQEADRVEREMFVIARQLWPVRFPGKTLPPDDPAGRHQLVKAVLEDLGKEHGKPEELVEDAKKTVKSIQDFITKAKILKLPDPDRCEIMEMPEFQRGVAVAYLNSAPPLDTSAKSVYAIAPPPSDWTADRRETFLREYNRHMLKVLTIHEAYPGHYVQLEYANRNRSLIRKVIGSDVYCEGWAVYTEQTLLDHGFGEGDLALRLHQLKFYMRAVLNAILDHKMHCGLMTEEEAMKMLTGRGHQTEAEAFGKVRRSMQTSCQLSVYFVGRTAFHRLRRDVARKRGDRFQLDSFHEEVLNCGSIPTKYLPELLDVTK